MKQIFIVEDNEMYAMMLDYILSNNSICTFVRFNSGEECIDNLYLEPDIIILDYQLPGMDGYETLLRIKEKNPQTHVIILSNQIDEELAVELLSAGADEYILKQGHGEEHIMQKIDILLNRMEIDAPLSFPSVGSSTIYQSFLS